VSSLAGGRVLCALGAAALIVALGASAAESDLARDSERELVLPFGPWPLPSPVDGSNRVFGSPGAIALGQRLFESPRLGSGSAVRCASCHEPWRAFADGRVRAFGLEAGSRNTPTLLNVSYSRWFGWDGASDTLWGQNIRPLLDPREMNTSAGHVATLLRDDPELSELYRNAFGVDPGEDDEAVLVDVAKALASYVGTLVTGRTAFDEYRSALLDHDTVVARRYPAAAVRGLSLFVGKGGCARCHGGPTFSDGSFHPSLIHSMLADGERDAGRAIGLERWRQSPYTRHGKFSDLDEAGRGAPQPEIDARGDPAGMFRTPALRGVARTAPYMHDGSVASLCDAALPHAIDYRIVRSGTTPPDTFALSISERHDIAQFLITLGEETAGVLHDPAATECHAGTRVALHDAP
jgi:cytochrome c peroxidase